ncbi:hypothetical protein GCM10007421_27870 [Halopseudomonas oceani]|uniref:NRDE family protein n=1 Tax=Halopseudomonas oceani TaxID=1708783 RepID=A0A2P4ETX7_9GAMM|nr:NRDE family protein [Halopseudomonas oceani]POB02741.1 hypothetical protein C1949_12530 [Halopseudomonas oceani]GGE51844.1 hypothetical protein GCM10007421_27870 [Halopseudomonas oceani]
MCLIAFAWQQSPQQPLLLIGNRDEFHHRPTRALTDWHAEGHPDLLAGKDLEAGGTWLGVTRDGRFAAVTNIRSPGAAKAPRSRGQLPLDYLLGNLSPAAFLRELHSTLDQYSGFNLLVGDREQLWFLNSQQGQPRQLEAGIYGLSNADLDSPWPKTQCLRNDLAENLNADDQTLFSLLANDQLYADEQLPSTGISLEWERMLSAAFIVGIPEYGTRASSVLRLQADGVIRLTERRFGPLGEAQGETSREWR